MSGTVTIGIVGLGYWGPNLLRNFAKTDGICVKYACDLSEAARQKYAAMYPSVTFTPDFDAVLNDSEVDAIVIATPVTTHFPLAKKALEAGKHVLVEKPLTAKHHEALELVALAKKQKKILMVDHTFVYEDAVQKIRQYVSDGTLGKLLYFDSTRINLGLIQSDTNVFWDLAVHDLSILSSLRSLADVREVRAYGRKFHTKQEEMGYLHLTFDDGFMAHIHVSWLSPVKIRQTLIGGTDKMIVYNDNEPSEKIRLYDKGVQVKKEEQTFALPLYRSGDVLIPQLRATEPLAELAAHFRDCIQGKEKPRTSGAQGAEVVEILELAMQSLQSDKAVPRDA